MMDVILLIAGFLLLIKGADIFVDASVGIAKKLKIPSIIIGLTIVAMGTSAPEAVVSITASAKGANALAIGNVVGSNIFNLLIVIGLCGLIKPIAVKLKEISRDFLLSIGAGIALLLMIVIFNDYIPRYAAFILLAVFIAYIIMLIRQALKSKNNDTFTTDNTSDKVKEKPLGLSAIISVVGCGLIIGGGQLTVNSAVNIALSIGITERLVGLTIVAIGTSLPELVTSIVACKKSENELALGNAVGSNIFNLLLVLGAAGIVSPLAISNEILFDLAVLTVVSIITLTFAYTGRKIVRIEGLTMVIMYTSYMIYICLK